LIFYELIPKRQVTAERQTCLRNPSSQEWWPKYLSRQYFRLQWCVRLQLRWRLLV